MRDSPLMVTAPTEARTAQVSCRSFCVLYLPGATGFWRRVGSGTARAGQKKSWVTREEFVEDWAVAQIMPGPNVVNLSLMLGSRYFGLKGAMAALAGMLARHLSLCCRWHLHMPNM